MSVDPKYYSLRLPATSEAGWSFLHGKGGICNNGLASEAMTAASSGSREKGLRLQEARDLHH